MKRPKLTAGQRLGMAFITAFAIFIYNCTTDQMRDSPKTAHIPKNPPRPEHAKNISEDEARTAGPLEIPFCPDCPKDLYFGDSPETVKAKMGRAPTKVTEHPEQFCVQAYETSLLNNLKFGVVGFGFKSRRLYTITIGFMMIADTVADSQRDLQGTLVQKYGEPSTFIQYDGLSTDQLPFTVNFWELPKSALLAPPSLTKMEDKLFILSVKLYPLRANGNYEINDSKHYK